MDDYILKPSQSAYDPFLGNKFQQMENAFPTPPKSHLMASKHSSIQFILVYPKCHINSKNLST